MIKDLKAVKENALGFTLIEVMVVIIMVGILAAIAVPIYSNYVYRARTAEAVTTLGAIKTFLIERENATSVWPTNDEMKQEFNNFNELYYFNIPVLDAAAGQDATTNPQIIVTITNKSTFGQTAAAHDLQLVVDKNVGANNGWKGTIRGLWAKHLPLAP